MNSYLESNLLIYSNRPVAEGDAVAEARLSLDGPLRQVHENLRALGSWVEQ